MLQAQFGLSEDELSELQDDFDEIDRDGSGIVDASEVEQLLSRERQQGLCLYISG